MLVQKGMIAQQSHNTLHFTSPHNMSEPCPYNNNINKTGCFGFRFFSQASITIFLLTYICVLFIGVVGNLLTIGVVFTQRSRRRAINLYTFNLAICDMLILCFYVPTQMSQIKNQLEWTMGEMACKSVNIILSASITCTIATLVAITIDRARGLITPFKWRTDSWKKAKVTVPCIWVWSFILNTPLFIYPRLEEEGNIKICGEGWVHETHGRIFWTVIFIISFSIPLIVITTTYVLIRCILRRGLRIMNPEYERRMTRMGVALVVVFFVCTGFQHMFYFLYTFSGWEFTDQAVGLLFGISNFLVSLQAALNPFLYSNIRQDLWKAVQHKVRRLLDLPTHIEAKRRESTIPRLSAYVVVKTNFIDDAELSNYDMCSASEKGSSEVKVTLKVPGHSHGGCRLSDITLHGKHLSVSSFGSAVHYLMEMELPRKLSMSLNVSLITTDDLESCKETAL